VRRWIAGSLCALALALLAGCAVGPKYKRADVQVPRAWKTQGPWEVAAPKDGIPKGAWWTVFGDAQLNEYEQQLLKANQSLIAARDRLEQARAFARVATSGLFPQLSTDPNGQRARVSANRPVLGGTPPTSAITENVFNIPFTLNYEVDLFGRVRRNIEAANASLQSTAADLQNAQLVLTAELAADYFTLHELDAEMQVVEESVAIQQKGLDLVQQRHAGGIASGLDVAQQASLLESTKTQLSLVRQQRAQYEHAIAVLTGNPPSAFAVPTAPLQITLPAIPVGMPSDLLERRPDIANAERQMAVQNAEVGVAMAAFYPRINLGGSGGVQSRDITSLVSAPSAVWSLGTDLLQPIFAGGRNRANLAGAKAAYNESVANYRETVLTAFQQVEDGISGLDNLASAAGTQDAAVQEAQRALDLANTRYTGGITSYLDVITAQSALLTDERLATQLLGQRLVTSVYLVKALGGGWDASQIQGETVRPHASQALQQ
jgi:NodT family efflux transporter outer membrane factor (OMF) lipoprotein